MILIRCLSQDKTIFALFFIVVVCLLRLARCNDTKRPELLVLFFSISFILLFVLFALSRLLHFFFLSRFSFHLIIRTSVSASIEKKQRHFWSTHLNGTVSAKATEHNSIFVVDERQMARGRKQKSTTHKGKWIRRNRIGRTSETQRENKDDVEYNKNEELYVRNRWNWQCLWACWVCIVLDVFLSFSSWRAERVRSHSHLLALKWVFVAAINTAIIRLRCYRRGRSLRCFLSGDSSSQRDGEERV